jgi:hypothetical protein
VNAEQRFEPERVVAALNEAGVRYVIVGGLAVGAHGVVRATRDIDVVPDQDAQNMSRLASALSQQLAHLRQMKRASERPRDAVDLAELEELHGRE